MGVSLLAILLASVPGWQVGSQSPALAEDIQGSFHPQNVQVWKSSWRGKKGCFLMGGKKGCFLIGGGGGGITYNAVNQISKSNSVNQTWGDGIR